MIRVTCESDFEKLLVHQPVRAVLVAKAALVLHDFGFRLEGFVVDDQVDHPI